MAVHLIWLRTATYLVCFIGAVWTFRIHLLIAVTQHSLGETPWLPTRATSLAWALRRCQAVWALTSPTRTHLVACVKVRTFNFTCISCLFLNCWTWFTYGNFWDSVMATSEIRTVRDGPFRVWWMVCDLDKHLAVGQNCKSCHFYYYFFEDAMYKLVCLMGHDFHKWSTWETYLLMAKA